MTYGGALAASCMRSALVTAIGLVVAGLLARWIQHTESRSLRRMQFLLLAAPFLTPNLIVGFGYRTLSINLLNQPWLNEFLYSALVAFELVPAATWLLLHSPPPSLSPEAWHVAALACGQQKASTAGAPLANRPIASWSMRMRFWWRGAGETLVGPAALLFVMSFQESELAALMQVAGWPERLFTDHVKGLPPTDTMKLVVWPALIQIPFVIPLMSRLGQAVSTPALSVLGEKSRRPSPATRRGLNLFGWAWGLAGIALVIGRPSWHLVDGLLRAGGTLALQPRWRREVWDAVLLAGTCVALTWGAAWALGKLSARGGSRATRLHPGYAISLLPGLIGTLALGLLTAGFFQWSLPQLAYTPLPLILAECLWLWPRVILVRGSIASRTRTPAHQARLLARSPDIRQQAGARSLWWRVAGRPLAGGVFLVGWWSYLEVMLPMILSLPGFHPAPMMMYNHLHYGQVEALGVKLAMILAVPLVLGGVTVVGNRLLEGRRSP